MENEDDKQIGDDQRKDTIFCKITDYYSKKYAYLKSGSFKQVSSMLHCFLTITKRSPSLYV